MARHEAGDGVVGGEKVDAEHGDWRKHRDGDDADDDRDCLDSATSEALVCRDYRRRFCRPLLRRLRPRGSPSLLLDFFDPLPDDR